MQRSLMERIFPHPRDSLNHYYNKNHTGDSILPQFEYSDEPPRPQSSISSSSSPVRGPQIELRGPSSSSSRSPISSPSIQSSRSPERQRNIRVPPSSQHFQNQERAASLIKPVISHNDPFLAVDRAAKALQASIQNFLDAQSVGLSTVLNQNGNKEDEFSSAGSLTPTPSTTTSALKQPRLTSSATLLKTIPVRQPKPKKITLRRARMGLGQSMVQFADLKAEELKVLDVQTQTRQLALEQVQSLEKEGKSLRTQISSMQTTKGTSRAVSLRDEANKVGHEIYDLEIRLQELKLRHRQLLTQSEQLENSLDSKLSSYKSSLALVEKEVRQLLRHPPVTHPLSFGEEADGVINESGLYSLRPERRSLDMAQDQWNLELKTLSQRKTSVETEQKALIEGSKLWREAVTKITEFEKSLRSQVRTVTKSQMDGAGPASPLHQSSRQILDRMNDLIAFLQAKISEAESQRWNLLICCLGAELEALIQAKDLLQGSPGPVQEDRNIWDDPQELEAGLDFDNTFSSNANADSLLPQVGLVSSNSSLEATLNQFNTSTKGKQRTSAGVNESPERKPSPHNPLQISQTLPESTLESEDDDDPSPDFLISHS